MGAIYSGSSNKTRRTEWDFSGGINTAFSPFDIKDNESVDEYGWDSDLFPARATAKGIEQVGVANQTGVVRLVCPYLNSYMLRAVNSVLERYDGTNWVQVASGMANAYYDYTHFNDKLFLVNGTQRKVWNGTTLTDFGISAMDGSTFICSDNSRLFVAKGDTVYYCGFQDENDWTSAENSGFFQYYTPRGGDITAMTEFYGDKWLFKKDAMAVLKGTSYFNYSVVEVSNDIGCINHKTLVEVGDTLMWLGEHDVYAHTGGRPSAIGNPIKRYLDNINKNAIAAMSAFSDGIRYYLNLCTHGYTTPNIRLVYDTRYNTWLVSRLLERFTYGCKFDKGVYAGDSAGRVYKLNSGVSVGEWSITSKPFDEGKAEVLKEYKELHLQGYFDTGSTLKVEYSCTDRGSDWVEIPYTFSPSHVTQDNNLIIPLDAMRLTNWARFRISGTGYVELQQIQRYFRVYRR